MEDKYQEYRSLSLQEQNQIVATNFFRVRHKLPLIDVPPDNKDYWNQFNKLIKL